MIHLFMICLICLIEHTVAADLTSYFGVNIDNDKASITMGDKQDIQLYRSADGTLNINAAKVKFTGKILGVNGNTDDEDDLRAALNKIQKQVKDLADAKEERDTDLEESHFVCKKGWVGVLCNKDFDDCTPNPCVGANAKTKYKHTCKDSGKGSGEFLCSCQTGWTGETCHQDVKDCTDCSKHGKCTEGPPGAGTYSCACTVGWKGKDCGVKCTNTDVGYYWSKSCTLAGCTGLKVGQYFSTHGGTSATGCAQKKCDAAPNGFFHTAGHRNNPKLCPHKDIDDCKPTPCKNGGKCTDTGPHSFKCACLASFSGAVCQVDNSLHCKKKNGDYFVKVWQVNGRGRMKINTGKVGKIATTDGVSSTAKLADSLINAITTKKDGYRLYFINTPDNKRNAYIHTQNTYKDNVVSWGIGASATVCLGAKYSDCIGGTWAKVPGGAHGIDLLHSSPGIGGQTCERYFLGHGGMDCWPANGNYRCVRGGGSCTHKGSFDGRTDHVVLNDVSLWVHVDGCFGKDACASNPCKNGGTCTKKADYQFTCKCKGTFTGKLCESAATCKVFGGLPFKKVWQVNGRNRVKINSAAYGVLNNGDSVTSTAKYADTLINSWAKAYGGYKRLYRLHSPDNGATAAYIRTNDAYNDMKTTWGMRPGSTVICLGSAYNKCGTWAKMAGHGLDLLHSSPGIGGQTCKRYFMGHGGLDCWPSNGNYRCVRGGGSCRMAGGYDGRTDHVVLNDASLWIYTGSC